MGIELSNGCPAARASGVEIRKEAARATVSSYNLLISRWAALASRIGNEVQ